VILAATGGGDKHCLVIEHQLRPLLAFLQAFAVPVGVCASHNDIQKDGLITSELVRGRVIQAARQAAQLARAARSAQQRSGPDPERSDPVTVVARTLPI
jgi:FMN reductase